MSIEALLDELTQIRSAIESRNALIRVLNDCWPETPSSEQRRIYHKHQRELAEDYIQYGCVLRRLVDTYDNELQGDPPHVIVH